MTLTRLMPKPDILLLLAPRFDEVGALCCVSAMRSRGLGVTVMGMSPSTVQSACGLVLVPDATLAEGETLLAATPQLLVLAGAEPSTALALADPRTHRLITHILAGGGHVAALLDSDHLFLESGRWSPEREDSFSCQRHAPLTDYVQQLCYLSQSYQS